MSRIDSNSFDTEIALEWQATYCPYCAFQCGIDLAEMGQRILVRGNVDFPVNKGALCIKGWTAPDIIRHSERLMQPLARNSKGELVAVSWNEALDRAADAFRKTQ